MVKSNNKSIQELEDEIKEMEKAVLKTSEEDVEEEEIEEVSKPDTSKSTEVEEEEEEGEKEEKLSKEESTWKERYANLRRKQNLDATNFQKKIEELETKISNSSTKSPVTEEEVKKWIETNPKAHHIITSIVGKTSDLNKEELNSTLRKLEERKAELLEHEVKLEIKKTHPDFDDITSDDNFHNWAEAQPKIVQDIIYDSLNAADVIWALNQYKSTLKTKTKKPKDDISDVISTDKGKKTSTPNTGQKVTYSESQVDKMSIKEYEKLADEIDLAQKEGRFIYDISGH